MVDCTQCDQKGRTFALPTAPQGCHPRSGQQDAAAPAPAPAPGSTPDKPEEAATSAGPSSGESWPADEALSQRVRQLCTLLTQAVVLAESQGLLLPLPSEGLALTERLLQLPPSAGYIDAAATFFDEALWQEEEEGLLEELLAADDDNGSGDESGDSEEEAAMYAAMYGRGRGRGRRGRGRGRGSRGGRTSKAERLAAEAAAFGAMVTTAQAAAADEEGDDGGGGRRRVHRPNSRYADHVLLPVAVHDSHGGGGAAGGGAGGAAGSHHHQAEDKVGRAFVCSNSCELGINRACAVC